jgi:uncharacterized protein (DUF2249 family)/iron-sulfur cluster repair protein YtfE (RIC family)
MNDVVIASNEADATAAAAVEQHHAELAGALGARVEALVAAAATGDSATADARRDELVRWTRSDLVPHALAEEAALYPAARQRPEGRLLVDGMLDEHRAVAALVDEVADARHAVRTAAAARALQVLFESHLTKENDLVLPLLTAAPDVSLAGLLDGMHQLLGHGHGHAAVEEQAGCGGHTCTCGEVDGPGYPELDARTIPHAIRHATIFGALDTVPAGGGLVLVAPHDPLPLLAQVEQRAPGAFEVDYLQRGPEAWRLVFVRTAHPAVERVEAIG